MPEKIGEEEIVLIITDRAFLYTAGNFDHQDRCREVIE